jgi:hypothetical protein
MLVSVADQHDPPVVGRVLADQVRRVGRRASAAAEAEPNGTAARAEVRAPSGPVVEDRISPLDAGDVQTDLELIEPVVTPADRVRQIAPWVAGGAAAIGVTFTSLALVEQGRATHAELESTNRRIDRYNAGAIAAYSTAGVALATWIVLELIDL